MSGGTCVIKPEDKYVGEKKNQLRHGYGVYHYTNKFYKYEGQWKNGLKHGHGKLYLGDSGYYEGTFENGEIEGHGYKVFALDGATYTGQFHLGVMHGQGLMRRTDGEQYEGCWNSGLRQGLGVLTGSDGGIYEGNFHQNLRHEEGVQIYSNGDQYEGLWVGGKRHGHGMLRCADGTMYDGQWKNDAFHGEGKMSHASGVVYFGMWNSGRPQDEVVKVKLAGEQEMIYVEQGKTFDLDIECVDKDGNVIDFEHGRSFKVIASLRKMEISRKTSSLAKSSSILRSQSSLKKPSHVKKIMTPFGYHTTPYELLQVPSVTACPPSPLPSISSSQTTTSRKLVTFDSNESTGEGVKPSSQMTVKKSLRKVKSSFKEDEKSSDSDTKTDDDDITRTSSDFGLHSPSLNPAGLMPRKRSGSLAIHRSSDGSQSMVLSKSDDSRLFGSKEEAFLATLSEPEVIVISKGKAAIKELFLPPPPAPDISHILSVPSSTSYSTMKSPRSPRGQKNSKDSITSLNKSPTPKTSKMSGTVSSTVNLIRSKEKLIQPNREKYCLPGTYVLIVSEVTQPPFMGSHLGDLYIEVTVVSPKPAPVVSIEKLLHGSNKKGKGSTMDIDKSLKKSKSKLVVQTIKE